MKGEFGLGLDSSLLAVTILPLHFLIQLSVRVCALALHHLRRYRDWAGERILSTAPSQQPEQPEKKMPQMQAMVLVVDLLPAALWSA